MMPDKFRASGLRPGTWLLGCVLVASAVARSAWVGVGPTPAEAGEGCSVAHLFNPGREGRTVVYRWAGGGEWTRLNIRASETATLTRPRGGVGEFVVVVEPSPAEAAYEEQLLPAGRGGADGDPLVGPQYAIQRDPCTNRWRVVPRHGGAGVSRIVVAEN